MKHDLRIHLDSDCQEAASEHESVTSYAVVDPLEALRVFQAAVRTVPHDADYYFILGCGLRDAGRIPEAMNALQEAVRLRDDAVVYRNVLGQLQWETAQYQEAVETFRAVVRSSPADAQSRCGLGAALLALGLDEDARTALERALENAPRRKDTRNNLGIAYWRLGQKARALRFLRLAAVDSDAAPYAHCNLGVVLAAQGEREAALASLKYALALEPDNADVIAEIGDCLMALGRGEEAALHYEAARVKGPTIFENRPGSREAHARLVADSIRRQLPIRRSFVDWLLSFLLVPFLLLKAGLAWIFRRRIWGAAFSIAILVIAIYGGWLVGKPLYRHYVFADDVASAAGASVDDDAFVRERIMHAVQQRGLSRYVGSEDCEISTRPRWRRITCRYSVPIEIGGRWRKTLNFKVDVERPYLEPR